MNKRFAELYDQALVLKDNGSGWEFDEIKFAELIVRECARVASDYDGAHYVGTAIEEYFGVKE